MFTVGVRCVFTGVLTHLSTQVGTGNISNPPCEGEKTLLVVVFLFKSYLHVTPRPATVFIALRSGFRKCVFFSRRRSPCVNPEERSGSEGPGNTSAQRLHGTKHGAHLWSLWPRQTRGKQKGFNSRKTHSAGTVSDFRVMTSFSLTLSLHCKNQFWKALNMSH